MAVQSIVDFVKESLSKTSEALPGPSQMATALGNLDAASLISALSSLRAAEPADEKLSEAVYVTYASKLLAAFQSSGSMTARQAFDIAGMSDFPTFQRALKEMARRGLVRVTGQDPKYNDDFYSLVGDQP